ncbi:DUF6443 domain-containing protein [Chryseobacterium sp. ISL-6]|uniref:DUF6443 domain-containing protein n=1 Tax=Chryseobacterium sp. ISL-6 TaxID=2819143 RepID=UPI001BED2ECD|nr:DUF6443 domain-containing protein [Chryseobacterium sp. ISL-6]MBT2620068.1 RHS repeat-associated core domain-containing protein [Chryseobacterium sp. ISL-6]
MKKLIIPAGVLLLSNLIFGQATSTENYIHTKTYLDYNGTSPTKLSETVQYFDGLGRPKQLVNVKGSPLGRDVVIHIEYDPFGRQVKDYLPVPQGNTLNGAITPDPLTNVSSSPYVSEKIYSEKIFENSPLDRIKQQVQVGADWSNKPVNFDYQVNDFNEVYQFITIQNVWENGATKSKPILSSATVYAPNQLYKNSIKDEDGNETIEFKNKKGQVLLVRKVKSSAEHVDTYYVYNEYDQLAFVIPPKAVHQAITDDLLNTLCYQYRYDARGRLVEKKLPGKGWEFMVYDKQDRVVGTQDAELNKNGQWLYTQYDQFGRVVISGIATGGERNAEQMLADGSGHMLRTGSVVFNRQGMDIYYDPGVTYPNASKWVTLLAVNYYDSYPGYSFNPVLPTNTPEITVLTGTATSDGKSTKGLPVMSFVKNIEDDNWTKNYTYYDQKGRVIGSHSINHLGGYTRIESKLDFAGLPQQIVTRHKRLATDIERVINENFEYDSQNRLLVHKHQVDSNPVEYLTQNTYNEISQLSSKKVGGIAAASPLQQIDYKYNIRGWLTKINDPANLNGKLFGYEIKYHNPVNPQGTGKFNGNIAEIDWNNGSENLLKRYNYEYDTLNRLTNAFYKEPSTGNTGYFDEYLSYDLNGNIMTLKRNASPVSPGTTFVQVDDLSYQYAGNRLDKVVESALNDTGYESGNNIIDYDLNGNMINMKDKGINAIGYNYLSLSDSYSITQSNPFGGVSSFGLDYLYRADGVKVRKTNTSGGNKGNPTITTNITDYLDGFQYTYSEITQCTWCRTSVAFEQEAFKDGGLIDSTKPITPQWVLDFVPTSEGFYSFTENRYIYQYRDHLGNARVSYAKNSDGILEITDTNNYYAFGANHIGGSKSSLGGYRNYKYNGKELQETGMYDYGARFYMADLGRWGVVDPLAEKGQNFSPYNYAINNPIRFIDPDGMWINISEGQNTYRYSDGQIQQQVEGEWIAADRNKVSKNVLGIVTGLHALENGGDAGKELVSYFDNDKNDVNIVYDKGNAGDAGKELSDPLKIDPDAKNKTPTRAGLIDSPFFVSLGHELAHKKDKNRYLKGGWFNVSRGEIFASHIENMIRAENNLPLRTSYTVNPAVFGGLDLQTVLIDCSGNSFYYQSATTPFEYNGRNGNEATDREFAAKSVYGTPGVGSSVLKRRYNYYENTKHTTKK